MSGLLRLWREMVRATERARDIGDAAAVAAIGVLLIAIGVSGAWAPSLGGVDVSPWWHLPPLLAICGIMLAKRRHPLIALLAGCLVFAADALAGGSLGVMLGLIDLIYSAALFAGPAAARRLGMAVFVVVIGAAGATFITGGGVQATVLIGLQVFAILGTPLWWGLSVRQQSELAALASARAADLHRLSELRETEVLREERMRMARDLHDALAGNLSAIAIHSEAALTAPLPAGSAQHEALSVIRSASVASLEEMRSMIVLLRTGTGSDLTVSPARLGELGELVEDFRTRGMTVSLSEPIDAPALPSAVDQAAYRIAQEALGNAAQHAAGAPVDVAIEAHPHALVVTVANPRTAQRPRPGGGLGLTTMRERAEALGGRLSAGWSDDSSRWAVTATLPLRGVES